MLRARWVTFRSRRRPRALGHAGGGGRGRGAQPGHQPPGGRHRHGHGARGAAGGTTPPHVDGRRPPRHHGRTGPGTCPYSAPSSAFPRSPRPVKAARTIRWLKLPIRVGGSGLFSPVFSCSPTPTCAPGALRSHLRGCRRRRRRRAVAHPHGLHPPARHRHRRRLASAAAAAAVDARAADAAGVCVRAARVQRAAAVAARRVQLAARRARHARGRWSRAAAGGGDHTDAQSLRIVSIRFGTGRQKMVLERWTKPKPQRRTCSPRYGVPSCRGKSAGVAHRPRERPPTRNPTRSRFATLFHRCR
jgi:hypothetical protein